VRRFGVALSLLVSLGLGGDQRIGQVDAIRAALRARKFEAAVERSRSALEQSPNDPQLWTLQGMALAGMSKRIDALQSFQRALKIDPSYLAALEGAAQLHFEAGSRRAVPLLNRVLRQRPGDPTAHAMLAVLAYREGNCQAAVAHFDKAGALIESQLDGLHAHATCLVRLQQPDAAVRVFQRAVALQPDNPRERQVLAAVQLMAEKPQDAITTLSPLLEAAQPDVETLSLASAAYEKSGDTPHAVATLRQAILLDPKNIDLYLDFANIAFAHESFQVGIEVLSDGLGLQPAAAPLYVARGVLYVQLADYEHAEADFEKASDLDPNQALSAAAQGLAAVQENDLDRALATIQATFTIPS
jgi:tetratricopeptide (TPR) repeat protein